MLKFLKGMDWVLTLDLVIMSFYFGFKGRYPEAIWTLLLSQYPFRSKD